MQLLGANGRPIQSEQAQADDAKEMEETMKKVFAFLQENRVPYNTAAGVGVNLILFFVRQQPSYQAAEDAANKMMTGLHNHLKLTLRDILQQQEAANAIHAANPQGQPS